MKYMKLGSKPDSFQTDGNNVRFVATELATDIIVNVGEVKFYLHKFPLLSKSASLQKLVAAVNDESNEEEIGIPDIPGGPSAFEICAKFCYGMTVTLNAYNVVAARCAAEYLEMHETVEKGNLIYKIEVFLNSSILRSWKDSIIVLQTTGSLLPWSEDLKLVGHCIASIASMASVDPSEVEWSYTYNRKRLSEGGPDSQWNGVRKQQSVPGDWWAEDLSELEVDSYKRVVMAIKTKGRSSPQVIGEALKAYAYRRLPGFGKGIINHGDIGKYQKLLDAFVWLLPMDKGSVSCTFLLKLLKAARLVDSGEDCKKDLIRRIGRQLHEASVSDLLIPGRDGDEAMYDVDTVLNIVEEFAMQEHGSGETSPQISEELQEVRRPRFISASSKQAVANLIDGYLAEVSKDTELPLSKFVELAGMVSSCARPVHDGLYRAIDTYLKEHPGMTKGERKKMCSLMDCKKLTADACTHAVQNERLPLRLVVQILFFEQLRQSAASTATAGELDPPGRDHNSLVPRENGGGASYGGLRSAATTYTEDEWDGIPTAGDIDLMKSMKLVGRDGGGASERSSASGDVGKVKGVMPKKLLSKLWSSKGQIGGENTGSDTSESAGGSINPEESKYTPSRNRRRSVS